MPRIFLIARALLVRIIAVPLTLVVLCLFVALTLGPPIALAWETFDILRLAETAPGTIDAVEIESGLKGTSRARISYSFAVGGRMFQSERYLPGFLANHGKWTGGASVAKDYPAGKIVMVHYNPANPSCCALEYGWFKASVGFTAILWGMLLYEAARERHSKTWFYKWISFAGMASAVYGSVALFFGPAAIRVAEFHWHALAWSCAFSVLAMYDYRTSAHRNQTLDLN